MVADLVASGTAWQRAGLAHFDGDAKLFQQLQTVAARLELPATQVLVAWELARLVEDPGAEGAAGELLLRLLRVMGDGGTRLRIDGDVRTLLDGLPPDNPVVGGAGSRRPLQRVGSYLCVQRLHALEARVASRLKERMRAPPVVDEASVQKAWKETARTGALVLAARQQDAVMRAATRLLTVVSGGPGTGKTSVVVSLLRLLIRVGVPADEILLAAPTGKAANRLGESMQNQLAAIQRPSLDDMMLRRACPQPQTVHRLLGYSPSADRFRHHEGHPLHARVVVIDEASMIDLGMMDQLLRAIPSNAQLVLLGDVDQLPPAEPGAVLHALMAQATASVTLDHSYRMDARQPAGANVYGVAVKVRDGAHAKLFEGTGEVISTRNAARQVAFHGVELMSGGSLDGFVRRWFEAHVNDELKARMAHMFRMGPNGILDEELPELRALYDGLMRFRMLCLTRSGDAGTRALNDQMMSILSETLGASASRDDDSVPGSLAVIERNDYGLHLFNGDVGVRVLVQGGVLGGGRRVAIAFPRPAGAFEAFEPEALRGAADSAFAMTVHKSQGSEHDHVAVMLPSDDIPRLLSRELIYTALTRARTSAVVVGSKEMLLRAVARRLERESGLGEMLR